MEFCPGCGRPLGNIIAPPQPVKPSFPQTPNYISSPQSPATPIPQNPSIRQPIQPEETSYQPRPAARPVLKLIHLTTGREFYLPGERGCIGRRSQIHGTIPEIDLVGIPNEGVVSRSHAQIFWDCNQHNYTILDTSKNGCYLNGNLLSQGVNYPLSNGDSQQSW
jgi:pSer/pThr/pTyr-binding forkhead associated (FHA) protein